MAVALEKRFGGEKVKLI